MLACKKDNFVRFELRAKLNSYSGTAGYSHSHSVNCTSFYRTGSVDESTGIKIVTATNVSAVGALTYTHTVDIPDLGVAWVSNLAANEVSVQVDCLLYAMPTYWRLVITAVRIYRDGVLDTTDSTGWTLNSNSTGMGLQPSAIPLFGEFAWTSARTITAITDVPPTNASSTIVGIGGWRFNDGSSNISLPVKLEPRSTPGISCPVSPTALPAATCTDSWTCTVPGSASVVHTGVEAAGNLETTSAIASVWIIPNIPRYLRRIQSKAGDFTALVLRFGMPSSTRYGISKCTPFGSSEATSIATTEVFPAQSQLLSVVGESPHAIEDTLGYDIQAPHDLISTHFVGTTSFGTTTGGTTRTEQAILTGANSAPSDSIPYYDSASAIARYVDYSVHPFRHFFLFFDDWEVDSSAVSLQDYWSPIREQWIYDSALPDLEQRRTRNHIIADACEESGGTWFDSNIANGVRPLGNSQWDKIAVDPLDSYTYTSASSSLWSASGSTLGHGGSITVTPSAAGTVTVDLDLGSFTVAPYQWPHIATHITATWSGGAITATSIKLIGVDGSEKEIGTVSGTRYPILKGGEGKYAGSWAIDNGFGAVTDLGTDADGNGISSATMSDPERSGAFQLLPVGPQKLRIEFTVSATTAITLNYPLLEYAPDDLTETDPNDPNLLWESGQTAALFWQNGPCIRFGNHDHFNDGTTTLLATPTVKGLGYKSTVLDFLCWRNLWLLGVAYDTNVNTDLGTLYNSVEGNSRTNASTFTIAWLEPSPTKDSIEAAIVNTLGSGVFPLALLPELERDPTTLDFTGSDRAQEVWSWCEEPRRFLEAGSTHAHLFDSTDVLQSVPETGWNQGYSVSRASRPLDNTETGWKIKKNGTHYGAIRPWHGFSMSLFPVSGAASNVSYDVSRSGRHAVAWVVSAGQLKIGIAGNFPVPLALDEKTPSVTGLDWCAIRWGFERNQKLHLFTEESGSIKHRESVDEGSSWSAASTIGSGEKPTAVILPSGIRYVYWIDGTDIKGSVYDAQDNLLDGPTVCVSGVDPYQISAERHKKSEGAWEIALTYSDAGGTRARRRVSVDGLTFGSATTIATVDASHSQIVIGENAAVYELWRESTGIIKIHARDNLFNALDSAQDAIRTSDDTGFALDYSTGTKATHRGIIFYIDGGILKQANSQDFSTFV